MNRKIKVNGVWQKTPEYRAWAHMKDRCLNPRTEMYKYYGGRGIGVCDRWLENFDNFLEDMGFRPGPDYSLDRIEPNGNYEPRNCRWASRAIQARNKRVRTDSQTGITGISPFKGKYVARINLGTFDTIEEAKKELEKSYERLWSS